MSRSSFREPVVGLGGALPSTFEPDLPGLDTAEGRIGICANRDGLIRTDPCSGERLDAPSAKPEMPLRRPLLKAESLW